METGKKILKFGDILEQVTKKPATSSFYLMNFKKHGLPDPKIRNSEEFRKLPTLSWEEVASVPYLERLYSDEGHIVKIINNYAKTSLIARTYKDIANEPAESSAERPLVLFRDMGDCLQWGLWFYSKNILPLAGEENIAFTILSAKKYGIDTLVVDSVSLQKLLPELSKQIKISSIKEVHVIDTEFNTELIDTYFINADVHFHIALPETGIIASSRYKPNAKALSFQVVNTILLEKTDDGLLLTNLIPLPFPFIRYKIKLPLENYVMDKNGFVDICSLRIKAA